MLERAIPNFLHVYFGLEGSIWPITQLPENEGTAIQWRKLSSFTAVTTALSEGVNPEPQNITISNVTGTVSEYGSYIRFTRSLAQFGIDNVRMEGSEALGEQAGDSLDLITRASLVAETSNVQWVNNRGATNSIVSGDLLTLIELMEAVTTLRTNKAVGPLASGCFPAILHPRTAYDLFTDPLFQAVLSYAKERGDTNPWVYGHLGKAFEIDFYESPNAYSATNSGSVVVHSTMLLGKGSYGIGGLAAYMPTIVQEQQDKSNHTFETVRPFRFIEKQFGSSGTNDPFDRQATIAWYTTFVATVLDATFFVRVEHDCALD